MRSFLQRFGLPLLLILVAVTVFLSVDALRQISQERSRAILTECAQQNQRHDATLATLTRVYVKAFHLPASTTTAELQAELKGLPPQARTAYTATLLMIDALAPRQNCQTVLKTLSK